VNYNYRYRLRPSDALEQQLAWTVDTCRQVYNHFLHRLNRTDDTSAYSEQKLLPSLKKWWNDLKHVHSKVLQKVVQRLYDNLSTLRGRKENGYHVGTLKWKAPSEYRSFTYGQSGFKLKNTSGRTRLWLSKLGEIPLTFHRALPDDAEIKTVTVKQEPTGKWYAILGVETPDDPPAKPETPEKCVGIDVGILKYAHDTDGTAVESFDLSDERERLERAQRDLSRKEHGSTNWEKQRRVVAERHAELKNKRRDFLHKPELLRPRIRLRGRGGLGRKGLDRTAWQLAEPSGSGVGNVPTDARIQVRTGRNVFYRGESSWDDERVCVLRRFDGEAAVGAGAFLSGVWFRGG